VVHVPVTEDGTGVVGGIGADPIDLLKAEGSSAKWDDGFRPVDVSFDACGRLLVSSDGTKIDDVNQGSKIVRIERTTREEPPTPAPNDADEPGIDPSSSTLAPSSASDTSGSAIPSNFLWTFILGGCIRYLLNYF